MGCNWRVRIVIIVTGFENVSFVTRVAKARAGCGFDQLSVPSVGPAFFPPRLPFHLPSDRNNPSPRPRLKIQIQILTP
jgi:hypothetical protein